jgi:hypothetical protein
MHRSPSGSDFQSEESAATTESASHGRGDGKGDGLGLTDLGHHHGPSLQDSRLGVLVMEAGIIFHSVRKSSYHYIASQQVIGTEG